MNGDLCPFDKEPVKLISFFLIQGGESRERGTNVSIKSRRDSPDTAVAVCTFLKLVEFILFDAVGRVSHDAMNGVFRNPSHPFETVCMNDQGLPDLFVVVIEDKL